MISVHSPHRNPVMKVIVNVTTIVTAVKIGVSIIYLFIYYSLK